MQLLDVVSWTHPQAKDVGLKKGLQTAQLVMNELEGARLVVCFEKFSASHWTDSFEDQLLKNWVFDPLVRVRACGLSYYQIRSLSGAAANNDFVIIGALYAKGMYVVTQLPW